MWDRHRELESLLQEERAEYQEQRVRDAKAIAILEVKDDLIRHLERELDAARAESADEATASEETEPPRFAIFEFLEELEILEKYFWCFLDVLGN